MPETCAVLTGDLVKSTKVDRQTVEAAFEALQGASRQIRSWPGEADAPQLERFRGDGWQMLVKRPERALRAALLCSAFVSSVGKDSATKVAVGIGPLAGLSQSGLGASDGPAFRASGRLLETMTKRDRIAADASESFPGEVARWIEASFDLSAVIAGRWTVKQAQVMARMLSLPAPTQAQVGEDLGVTQQTIQGHFEGAEGPVLLDVLERIEGS